MSANAIFVLVLVAFGIGTFLLNAASIKWGLKRARIRDISIAKALGLFLLFFLAAALSYVLLFVIALAFAEPSDRILDVLAYVCQFATPWFVVAIIYKVRLAKAAQAIVPFWLVSIAMPLLAVFLIRPYAYEAFWIPTNSMAPTLLGTHWTAPCPRCGHAAYGTPLDPNAPIPPQGVMLTCSNERQAVNIADPPMEHGDGDRILTCKFISPNRWDMIVFKYPENPTVNYVMRLVGLPGEKLAIHDGAVWINGEKIDPPPSLSGIRYSSTIEVNGQVHSGPGSAPVELGHDEYFVLGDFVEQSSDSRFWQRGARGHPPFAVPESHFVGVVINIYWPVSRWASFR